MSSTPTVAPYDQVFYQLVDDNSELNRAKREYEEKLELFLQKYRPYSSVGANLTEPLINIKKISDLIK